MCPKSNALLFGLIAISIHPIDYLFLVAGMLECDSKVPAVALRHQLLVDRIHVHDIDHLMDNYSRRPEPMPPGGMAIKAPSSSRDYGWRSDVLLPRIETNLRAGIEFHGNQLRTCSTCATPTISGGNRVSGGDLAVGERIPSAGRFAYAPISWEF